MARNVPHQGEAVVRAGGIYIVYDSFGDPGAPPLLLIMIELIRALGYTFFTAAAHRIDRR
jgi:hypothetical protein